MGARARRGGRGVGRASGARSARVARGIQTAMAQGRSTQIISMIKWIRTSRLSIDNSLSLSYGGGRWVRARAGGAGALDARAALFALEWMALARIYIYIYIYIYVHIRQVGARARRRSRGVGRASGARSARVDGARARAGPSCTAYHMVAQCVRQHILLDVQGAVLALVVRQ